MSTNSFPIPKIDVLHWNARNVYVECPYCEEIHRHGVEDPGRRASNCFPGGQYEFIFPIDKSSKLVGYEIDKRRACFVNASLQRGQRDGELYSLERDECELADLFHTMKISGREPNSDPVLNLEKVSREMETITLPGGNTFEQKRIRSAVSECVHGNLPAISQYLNTSVEANLFLHGKNETGNMNTTLIMAAAEKSHEMVSLLLRNGADVNAINNDGRSALMEAALWGRMESVKALLNSNADKGLRDRQGRCAMDLAQAARKNEKERYGRSPIAAAKSVPERDRDRRHIVILLGDSNAEKRHGFTSPLSRSERDNYGFRKPKSEMAITLCGPIRSYRVPRITKTAAVLDRGDQFTRISATSGWGPDALPLNSRIGPHWIQQVYYIASIIGHEVRDAPDPGWDQGKPGQYFASHAEKKLIAYFLDKHVFMPQDREPDQTLKNSILELEDSPVDGRHSSAAWTRVCDLEERKSELDLQLFDADDLVLGDSYDEQEVKRLKHEICVIDEELLSLDSDADVATMRAQKEEHRRLLKRQKIHQDLIELSKKEPSISLTQAVILSSNKICEDCDNFKEKVNDYFQLNIEMSWRIWPVSS
ncbi:uncharacterized protein F5Z01DRAFT_102498 [Emericellopsis atlantica]|uniref:Single-strand DNA deaminase toxin A-like C-terminal domain-containing protein n=1 Tax=Emericellopsis atlantica TaxID=2614577 RepID=A0A9P7ZMJ2_9HYPO|nr:uncharacterized protein F5Z01DRAFT_102498 [Emericellopsis atlantica]KAG9254330.1 hypothetical protein F5Z01DRAFT_102498 [Emericellopsis atlantica]